MAILAHVGVWQAAGGTLGLSECGRQLVALWVLSEPSLGMTDLLGHAVGQT